ncbi:hypothetical protein BJ508DRAFT_159721 [Ascobolus immersus RN42]|uniref:Uncharacterized protein n=1 Tax=Ascobolus immersus RN42 TaxID=1160509 RepID=A0A3N4IIX8_ASCIM|nr:hypothetical protein BJ508DRAFT_159721 [Ascobolus immersus RN42]
MRLCLTNLLSSSNFHQWRANCNAQAQSCHLPLPHNSSESESLSQTRSRDSSHEAISPNSSITNDPTSTTRVMPQRPIPSLPLAPSSSSQSRTFASAKQAKCGKPPLRHRLHPPTLSLHTLSQCTYINRHTLSVQL